MVKAIRIKNPLSHFLAFDRLELEFSCPNCYSGEERRREDPCLNLRLQDMPALKTRNLFAPNQNDRFVFPGRKVKFVVLKAHKSEMTAAKARMLPVRRGSVCMPLGFGAMSHTQVKPDYAQKNRTGCQTPLMSAEQHKSLELDRQQARG